MGKLLSANMVGLIMFQIVGTTLGKKTNPFLLIFPFILELAMISHFGIGFGIGIGIGFLLSSKWGLSVKGHHFCFLFWTPYSFIIL